MSTDSEIIDREKQFWTGSTEYYERWLAGDVLMIFPGATGILNRAAVLDGIRTGSRWASVAMTDVAVRSIGESSVALAYRACARKPDSTTNYRACVGSVYVREGGEWKLAFHQHTPLDDRQKA